MGPRTWKIISRLKTYCDLEYGRRSKLARALGLQRQVLTHWFANRKQPSSEQILMIQEFLRDLESENRMRNRAVITMFDGDRIDRYTTLLEAVAAAQNWYSKLAGRKLPKWNYRIGNFDDFAEAIDDYKVRIARSLRYGKNYHQKLRLTVLRHPLRID
jgi:hypothetical protein